MHLDKLFELKSYICIYIKGLKIHINLIYINAIRSVFKRWQRVCY